MAWDTERVIIFLQMKQKGQGNSLRLEKVN
jgi:hypothetical protein